MNCRATLTIALSLAALLLLGSGGVAAPIGFWSFDDGSVDDLSINANHGLAGSALAFNATDTPLGAGQSLFSVAGGGAPDVLTVPTSTSLQSINDSMSIAFWMKGNTADNANWVRMFQHGDEAKGNRTWLVNRNSSTSDVGMRVDTLAKHNTNLGTDGPDAFDGTWKHVAYTLNSGDWRKYEDGALAQSGTYTHGDGLGTTRPLYMFGRNGVGEYVGGLDDIALYDTALTLPQVQYLFGGGDPLALPVTGRSTYALDGNVTDSAGTYDGTAQDTLAYVASPLGGQALDLSGQHVDLTNASNLGIQGNFTASAWIKPDATNGDRTILGTDEFTGNKGLHLIIRNDKAHMGFYGNDLGGSQSIDTGRWQHVAWRFENGQQSIFVDGALDATGGGHANFDGNDVVQIGRAGNARYFDGQIDNIDITQRPLTAAEIRSQFLAGGTHVEDFEDTGGRLPNDWYVGCGSNATRLRTNDNPDGTYGLVTSGNNGNPNVTRTIYNANHNDHTDTAWGTVFTVNDDTASLNFKIIGGSHALNAASQRAGGNAVALWDVENNDFIAGKSVTRSTSSNSYESKSIPLSGLAGREVAVVLVDRQESGWGWGGVDSITTDPGAITASTGSKRVYFDYHFDRPGDLMGWQGDTNAFTIGNMGDAGLSQSNWHVNLAGTFGNDRGFLSSGSAANGGIEASTGALRSPSFTVTGDLIEFRVSGGNTADMGLELVRAGDGVVLRTGRSQANRNDMAYDHWNIRDLAGTEAYLRIRDNRVTGGWGHIEVDALRMVELNAVDPFPMRTAAWGNAPVASLVHDVRNPGELVLAVGGSDIQGNSDNGAMAYLEEPVSGAFNATAHVSFDGPVPNTWTKAGLMYRQSDAANAANVFVLASGSNRPNLQWRNVGGDGTGYNQAASGSPSNNIWLKIQRWENGQVSGYWAPDSLTMPTTGWQRFGTDAMANFDTGLLGLAATSHNTNSVVDARFRGMEVNLDPVIESFESYGGDDAAMRENWYSGGNSTTMRLRDNYNPDGVYGMLSSGTSGSPTATLNVFNSSNNDNTGMAWGSAFRVLDDTASISLNVIGGSYAFVAGSQRGGGTGVALWDIQANDFVPDTFTTRSSSLNSYEQHAISLAGLEGRWVLPVLIDRQVSGWGWTGVDSITAPDGAVQTLPDYVPAYDVLLDFSFDTAGDFMGWQQVDSSGNPVPITDFQLGNTPIAGGLLSRHINEKGTFTVGEGFVSSTNVPDGWDSPTGILRSPEFVIDGDILDFYISGGNRANLSFELWGDEDGDGTFSLLRTTRHQADNGDFDYEFWTIADLAGTTGYLQLVDANPGGWGHIELDAIHMVRFNIVPEPSSFLLAALALAGVGLLVRRRRNSDPL